MIGRAYADWVRILKAQTENLRGLYLFWKSPMIRLLPSIKVASAKGQFVLIWKLGILISKSLSSCVKTRVMNVVVLTIWIRQTGFLIYLCNVLPKKVTGHSFHLKKHLICMILSVQNSIKPIKPLKKKRRVAILSCLKPSRRLTCGARCLACYLKQVIRGSPLKTLVIFVTAISTWALCIAQTYVLKSCYTPMMMKSPCVIWVRWISLSIQLPMA